MSGHTVWYRQAVMKLFTYCSAGKQSLWQSWCFQSRLCFYFFHTIPTTNGSSYSQQSKRQGTVTRKHITAGTYSVRDLTNGLVVDEKFRVTTVSNEGNVEGTVTKPKECVAHTQKSKHSGNSVEMLAKLLKCSTKEMEALVDKYNFFTHLSPDLIKSKINIMLFHGLPYSFIFENPRLLYQTSSSELSRRLQLFSSQSFLSENSVVKLDYLSHYLECKNDRFDWTFLRLCAEKEALEGCFDKLAYIQYRLNVTREQALQFLSSCPLKKKISNVRLKKLLDFFLIETKLGAEFVIKHKRLFLFSVVRLRTRWEVIVSEGIRSEAAMIDIFNMSEKKFQNKYSKKYI